MADKFSAWAIIEVMGHTRKSGRVTEETIAGAPMLRVDVPSSATDLEKFTTHYLSAQSIFQIHPCDENTARLSAVADGKRESYEYDIDQYLARVNERATQRKLRFENRDGVYDDSDRPDPDDDTV